MRQTILLVWLLTLAQFPVLWCSVGFPYSTLQNGLPSTSNNRKKYLFDVQQAPNVKNLPSAAGLEETPSTEQVAYSGSRRSVKSSQGRSDGISGKENGLQSEAGSRVNTEKKPRNVLLRLMGSFLRFPGSSKTDDSNQNGNEKNGEGNGKNRAMKRKAFDVSYRQHLSDTGKNAYHPLIMKGFERFQVVTSWTAAFVEANKSRFRLVGKAAIFATIGVVVARRVVNWYRGISDFEVLLDKRDVQYHTHGGVLRQAAVTVLSGVNHTAVTELKYEALYDKIVSALDKPCYPQLTQGYCVHTGRTTAVLLSEIDNRIRSYRRRVSRQKASHPGRDSQGPLTLPSTIAEGQVLLSLQRGITLLQSRQADAFLRVTRSHLLTAANTLEDLLAQSRRRHSSRVRGTLNSRLTGLRTPRGTSATGAQRVKLSESDKCEALEHMLRWYYTQSATVQRHLDGLTEIEAQLDADPAFSHSIPGVGSGDNMTGAEAAAWAALEAWVSTASALATQSATTMRSGLEVDAPLSGPLSSSAPSQAEMSAVSRQEPPGPSASGTLTSLVQASSANSVAGRRGASTASEDALSSKVADFAHAVLDTLTSSVLGETSEHTPDRNVVIAQLALLVVHLLGTAHDGDATEELVCEFTLHGDVRSVITSCVVDSQPMLAALEQGGHEVTQVQPWEAVHRNNISFAHYLSQLDSGVLNTTVLNSLWYRELRYRSLRYTLLLERDPSEHLLLQVLNTAGRVAAPLVESVTDPAAEPSGQKLVETSAVLLALCVDLPAHDLHTEGANCTMKWVFSPVSPAHVLSPSGSVSENATAGAAGNSSEERVAEIATDSSSGAAPSRITRVRVTLSQSKPQGVYQLLTRHFVGRHVRAFVDSWRAAAEARVEETGKGLGGEPEEQLRAPVEQALLHSLDAVGTPRGAQKRLRTSRPLGAVKLRSSRYEYQVDYATSVVSTSTMTGSAGELLRLADEDGTVYLHDLREPHRTAVPTLDDANTRKPRSEMTARRGGPERDGERVSDAVMSQLYARSELVQQCFQRQRSQWRASGVILQDLQKAPSAFSDHLVSAGLQRKSQRGVLSLIRPRVILRLVFWSAVAAGGLGLTKKSSQLSFRAESVARHINSFVERRVVRPLTNILNDVVLNKRVSITDQTALKDAKRSLSAMIYDFLLQHGKTLSEAERKRIATTMDMRPISEEYELELRRPMQSIVSGKIARLVLIQLQFVKKELLVAMQAIDDLFNANQVNLQLLAITPAVLSIVSLNIVSKTLIAAFRATSRGKKVESSAAINRELREGVRAIERVLFLFHGNEEGSFNSSGQGELSLEECGRVLSSLYKMQGILVMNNNFFESSVLRQLQDDLRDLALPDITVAQRTALIERLYRVFPSTQPSRNIWGNAFNQ